jgi:hypothetical protein
MWRNGDARTMTVEQGLAIEPGAATSACPAQTGSEHGRIVPPTESGPLPQHAVTAEVRAQTERMFEPGGYEITGYILTQRISSWKALVDVTGVRRMGAADLARLMNWQEPAGTADAPEGAGPDVLPQAISSPAIQAPAVARPVLTRPRSHEAFDHVEQAYGELATRLGCVYNDTIAHNAGWFVPGKPTAYASPLDAIEGLVGSLRSGGTVYEPRQKPMGSPNFAANGSMSTGVHPVNDGSQQGLF